MKLRAIFEPLLSQIVTVKGIGRVGGYCFSRTTSALAGLAISFILIRSVTANDYNRFAAIHASITFFAPIIYLWIQNCALRFGGESGEWDQVVLIYTCVTLVLYVPLQYFTLASLRMSASLGILGAFEGAFLGLTPIIGNVHRGHGRETVYNVVDGIASVCKIIILCGMFIMACLNVQSALVVLAVVPMIQACFLWRIGRFRLPFICKNSRIVRQKLLSYSKGLFVYGLPLAMTGCISSVTQYFDRVFIPRSVYSQQIGEYFFTASIGATVVLTLLSPVNMALYPKCIRMHREGKSVNHLLMLGIFVCGCVFLVVAVIFFFMGGPIIRILSSGRFTPKIGWLELFALSQVLVMANSVLQIPLHLARQTYWIVVIGIVSVVCYLFMFPRLLGMYGISGAIQTAVIAALVQIIGTLCIRKSISCGLFWYVQSWCQRRLFGQLG